MAWRSFNLYFPEFYEGMEGALLQHLIVPKFSAKCGVASFKIDDLNLEVHFENSLEGLSERLSPGLAEDVEKGVLGILNEDYLSFLPEFKEAREGIDILRTFVNKKERGGFELQDHLTFTRHSDRVSLYDYFHLNNGSGNYSVYPTGKILQLRKCPVQLLNHRGKSLYKLGENVVSGEQRGCNSIVGSSISDCVENALSIYTNAEFLAELDFEE